MTTKKNKGRKKKEEEADVWQYADEACAIPSRESNRQIAVRLYMNQRTGEVQLYLERIAQKVGLENLPLPAKKKRV